MPTIRALDATASAGAANPWEFHVGDYGAMGDNSTDDTAAIIAAVNAAVAYATSHNFYAEVVFDPVTYLLSSPTTKGGTTFGNAQIPIPYVDPTGSKVVLVLQGSKGASSYPHWLQTTAQRSGTVLRSTLTGLTNDATWKAPSILGGPTVAQGSGKFTNLCVVVDGITVMAPQNPGITGIDLGYVAQAEVWSMGALGDAGPAGTPSLTTKPTNSLGLGLKMPVNLNNAKSVIVDYACEGWYYGLSMGEHMTALRVSIVAANTGLLIGPGQIGGTKYHGISITNLCLEICTTGIYATGTPGGLQPLIIDLADVETLSGNAVDDANSVLVGSANWADINNATPTVNGATNFTLTNVFA